MFLAGSARAACQLGAVAVLPLERQGDGLVFAADINGKQANFILDTGSYATVLTRRSAERLGVRMSELDSESYGVGGTRHNYRGVAQRMRIGNLDADHMVLGGLDFLDESRDSALDGLFGMNLMAAYDIDLDFVGQHAIIFEADGNCSKPAVALSPPLYSVPLVHITNNRQADVDIAVDGHNMRAVIDSGAGRTVMFRNAARRLGVDLSALHQPGHQEDRGIGPARVASVVHVFSHVTIGNLTINNMPVRIIDQGNLGIGRVHIGSLLEDRADGEPGGEDMLLGADFMQRVHLWISHSSQRLIMQYPPQPSVLPK